MIKLCKDCRYYSFVNDKHLCTHKANKKLVDGDPYHSCGFLRSIRAWRFIFVPTGKCGREGRFWKEKGDSK